MCGIIGLFHHAGDALPLSEAQAEAMLDRLAHRGPDGRGRVIEPGLFLGHVRLAVLDVTEASAQPMASSDGRLLLSFNGEIYNFRELRRELEALGHGFRSQGDTEVLLAAWRQWGPACVERLRGMFAFALFDRTERRLHLVRDRLGIKPLFWFSDGCRLTFASEPQAMFGPALPLPEADPLDLDAFFTFNYLAAPRTGLKGVRQLPPGCRLTVDAQGLREDCYWQPALRPERPWSPGLAEEFRALTAQAVTRQMVSDVPVGVFLSGGLDSFLVAASAGRPSALVGSYTLAFSDPVFDESPIAEAYAAALGLPGTQVGFAWDQDQLQATLADMRELLADPSCFPLHQLCRAARRTATVVLSGDGGDELLAGYDTYRVGPLSARLHHLPPQLRQLGLRAAALLPRTGRYAPRMVLERLLLASAEPAPRDHASFRRIFQPHHKQALYHPDFKALLRDADPVEDYAGFARRAKAAGASELGARQQADIQFHLPALLAKVDRMSMAHGLEVRVPLLDEDVVGFAAGLADDAKRQGKRGKRILREAVAPVIPPRALALPKAGFLPPVDAWFRHDAAMRTAFGDLLAWARPNLGWLDWAAVEALWLAHRQARIDAGMVLLSILQFMNWSRQCRPA